MSHRHTQSFTLNSTYLVEPEICCSGCSIMPLRDPCGRCGVFFAFQTSVPAPSFLVLGGLCKTITPALFCLEQKRSSQSSRSQGHRGLRVATCKGLALALCKPSSGGRPGAAQAVSIDAMKRSHDSCATMCPQSAAEGPRGLQQDQSRSRSSLPQGVHNSDGTGDSMQQAQSRYSHGPGDTMRSVVSGSAAGFRSGLGVVVETR